MPVVPMHNISVGSFWSCLMLPCSCLALALAPPQVLHLVLFWLLAISDVCMCSLAYVFMNQPQKVMLLARPTNGTFGLDAKVLILVFGLACASVQSGGHPRVQSSPPD